MKAVSLLLIPVLALAGCSTGPTTPADDLDRAALEASRDGSLANYYDQGRGRAGIEAAGRVTERYYWVAKYAATPQQREVATKRGQAVVKKMSQRKTKPKSRYIAVTTKRDSRAKTSTNVMIFDTQSNQIVGNNVYDLNDRPPQDAVLRFETYSASYFGAGQ